MNDRKNTRAHALSTLDMAEDNHGASFTAADVDHAYRQACKRYHPDTTMAAMTMHSAEVSMSYPTMATLQQAREFLKKELDGRNNACVQCRGLGIVRAKMGATPCGACNGTGDKNGR